MDSVVNTVFTYSGSHRGERAGASGLFDSLQQPDRDTVRDSSRAAWERVETPEGRRSIALCFIDVFGASWVKQILGCGLFLT